ncbi:MAG TPA: MupA/Atu3671 family FMN-dependent luciferase-like monooxygenase [Rugosimonospora sp.]|nr:MupA/Atu3671 family FMN-dependent luciferase-like monooxygenase [Rugosimonospora sp.]
MDFSLFFFADSAARGDCYRLLLACARFADANGFAAVWTPERHFHPFGGRYPNPAVVGAALATATQRVGIRAGSVVAPLHHPVRIAEEWSVVDNLSGGRVGVAFASGWHAADFVLRPENYPDRKAVMVDTLDSVRRLWRGGEVEFPDAAGGRRAVRVYPAPVQRELPVWITSGGTPDTFRAAARLGAGVLTHQLSQSHDGLAQNIAAYRSELAAVSGTGARGHVSVMLHTMIGTDRDEVREVVREPFSEYLSSSMDLLARDSVGVDLDRLSPANRAALVARSFDRYFDSAGLFGSVDDGMAVVRRLADAGVDEIACLVDFGVAEERVLASLEHLGALRHAAAGATVS